jgi:diaminopimelate decarboxylase
MKTDHPTIAAPILTPLISPWVSDLVTNKERLKKLVTKYDSPINIYNKSEFHLNIQAFQNLANELEMGLGIFFARKANKSKTFVTEAKAAGIGVDTASYQEVKDCLDVGLPAEKIVLTAAIKNRKLISLAVEHDILIVLDNRDELDLLAEICKDQNSRCKVALRISGFLFEDARPTRFGFVMDQAKELICEEFKTNSAYQFIDFQGFHFHINGYSIKERATALIQSILLADELDKEGVQVKFIDIGGGFLVNYLESKSEWEDFHEQLRKSISNKSEPITFQNDSLGMVYHHGEIIGKPKVYPYYNECAKDDFLRQIITSKFNAEILIFEALRSRGIELRIEPGRSLLDQTGVTVAEVMFRKTNNTGINFVGLAMNRTQMKSSSEDFLLDPIYIPIDEVEDKDDSEVFPCYLVGSYCLEQELILKRRIDLPHKPAVGDLICFVNTAGYMSHFYESQAHLLPLSKNIFFDNEEDFEGDFEDVY